MGLPNSRAHEFEWKESPEAHVFKADLPGLRKEEVEVEEERILQISGERSKAQEEKNDRWHRAERSSGKFLRRFPLPENARVEEAKASMENRVLTVMVPKAEEKKPEVKAHRHLWAEGTGTLPNWLLQNPHRSQWQM